MSPNDKLVPWHTKQTDKKNGNGTPAAQPSSSVLASQARNLSPETSGTTSSSRRRILLLAATATLSLAIAVPIGIWIRYRHLHVLSQNAQVRGQIADVGAQFKGVVSEMRVDAGDYVRAGQLIARLEDDQLRARVDRAQSQLERASRELAIERLAISQARRSLESEVMEAAARLGAAEAELHAAESIAIDAREQYELRVSLSEEGVVPRELVRKAKAEHRTAEALVVAADADRAAADAERRASVVDYEGLSVREAQLTVLESRVTAFEAELSVARADLEATQIRAPGDGRVVRRLAEPGTSLDNGQPLLSLWIDDRLWVEAWIDEGDVSHVDIGSPATVTLKPYPDREFSGVVESMGVSTDLEVSQSEVPQPRWARMRGTPVVPVRIRLDDREVNLVPGLSAVVAIRKLGTGAGASQPTLPQEALPPVTLNGPR